MQHSKLKAQAQRIFLQAVEEQRRSTENSNSSNQPTMDHVIPLIKSHLDQAQSKYQIRTELPGKIGKLPIFRPMLIKNFALRAYEFLFREQRAAGLAQLNAWRDFLYLYTHDHNASRRELVRVHHDLQEKLFAANKENDASRRELVRVHHDLQEKLFAANEENEVRNLNQQQQLSRLNQQFESQRISDLKAIEHLEEQVVHLKENLTSLHSVLEMQAKWIQVLLGRLPGKTPSSPSALSSSERPASHDPAPMLDTTAAARYVAFEDHFRGLAKNIHDQFAQDYLPVFERFGIPARAHVLDIGCGRGEWLELMQEQGFNGRGIDLNPIVCELCQSKGLDVTHGDALAFLAKQPAASLDVITAFHVVEHLSEKLFDDLVQSAFHVLRPGGVLIMETPNPENFIVGSCNFYNDPTHQHPLPPESTQFRVRSHGFSSVDVLRLHPRGQVDPKAIAAGVPAELLERLFIGQDYAVIASR